MVVEISILLVKLNTPQFNVVERTICAKSTNYIQETVEYHRQICYKPTSGMCFIKFIKNFTGKDYTEEFLTFITNDNNRSRVLTTARIQRFCRKYKINIGYYDGFIV